VQSQYRQGGLRNIFFRSSNALSETCHTYKEHKKIYLPIQYLKKDPLMESLGWCSVKWNTVIEFGKNASTASQDTQIIYIPNTWLVWYHQYGMLHPHVYDPLDI
jgi:hypothetical protein